MIGAILQRGEQGESDDVDVKNWENLGELKFGDSLRRKVDTVRNLAQSMEAVVFYFVSATPVIFFDLIIEFISNWNGI